MRLLCLSTPASIVESRTEPASSELETATMTSTGYQLQTAMIGQQLLESDYHVHELPACDEPTNDNCWYFEGHHTNFLSMAYQPIVCVYAFLTNFGPALVSSPEMSTIVKMMWMHISVRFQNVIPKILKLLSITVIALFISCFVNV